MSGHSSESTGRTEIRRLAPDGWATLRQVRLAALADAPAAFSSTLDRELGLDEQRWRERIESAAWFLAWQAGRPVGMVAGFAGAADAADRPGRRWHLVSMWVSPRARGRGTADRLVEEVATCARQDGADMLVLWVTDVNARGRAFYRRMGFRSTGRRQLVRPTEPDHWEEELARPLG
jgi:ribosomal protein S18 acetylase RimI-like enzyme